MPEEGPGLGERLGLPLTRLALCWRLLRQDGVALGFTSHDRGLVVEGLRYEHAPGIAPSAVQLSDGLEVDTMEMAGALSSAAITARDLLAGRYDGAAVEVFLVDWQVPEAGRQLLSWGRFGGVDAGEGSDSGFVARLLGPTAVLQATAVERYSPECRAELGDGRCRVSLRGRLHRGQVVESIGAGLRVDLGEVERFVEGRVRVLEGDKAGLERRIIAIEEGALLLDAPLDLGAGTPLLLHEGCDKSFATCAGRFGNAANFRGEPHVPGGDLLMRIAGL